MAGNQKNYENFLYVDDNAVSWTKRGETGGGATAVDGHASGTGAPTWIDGPRMRCRKIIYQNAASFRTVSPIFYTAAAFAAVTLGDTITPAVQGLATAPNYVAIKKLGEKQPARGTSRKLADIT